MIQVVPHVSAIRRHKIVHIHCAKKFSARMLACSTPAMSHPTLKTKALGEPRGKISVAEQVEPRACLRQPVSNGKKNGWFLTTLKKR